MCDDPSSTVRYLLEIQPSPGSLIVTLYSPLYANIHDIYTHPRYTVRRSGSDNQVTVSLETLTALARVSFIWYRTSLSVGTPESVIHSAFSDLFNYKNTLFHLKEKKKKTAGNAAGSKLVLFSSGHGQF